MDEQNEADSETGEDHRSESAGAAATGGPTEHVLVAYDGTPQSVAALEHACRHHDDARVTVLYAIDPVAAGYSAEVSLPSTAEEWYETARARAESALEEASAAAGEFGVDPETVVEVGRPSTAILEYVREYDVDHVVVGSHGRSGVSRILLGSVAESVMRESPAPVTVVR